MLSLPTLQTHRGGQDLKGEPEGHPAEGGGQRGSHSSDVTVSPPAVL